MVVSGAPAAVPRVPAVAVASAAVTRTDWGMPAAAVDCRGITRPVARMDPGIPSFVSQLGL